MFLKAISPNYIHEELHFQALALSSHCRRTEAELIEVLEEIDSKKVYLEYGYSSLFQYALSELTLSESTVYNFISVMRKTREVPILKEKIREGLITLSNARKIAPVLTLANQNEWMEKAINLSNRKLEKEIVKVRPQVATPERASYVTEKRIKLELGLSEQQMLRLRRVQDLVSQSTKSPATLEVTLIAMIDFFLKQKDPLHKATRMKVKKGFQSNVVESARIVEITEASPNEDEKVAKQSDVKEEPVTLQAIQANSVQANSVQANSIQAKLIPELSTVHLESSLKNTTTRESIPASLLHQVNLRDQRKCKFIGPDHKICGQTRWLEVHHIKPVHQHGKNILDNLITLCSAHHKWMHRKL